MAATITDLQVAAAAGGFFLGFGFLTTWEAIKQTIANKSPLRSIYIYMVWGEIAANLAIAIIAWLLLHGVLKPTVPTLFFGLFFWAFEIQLLMQIIVNRISIIADNKKFVRQLKISSIVVTTMINISVFCLWIPAHQNPPVSQTFADINKYWDRINKVIICFIDAGLNYYFLRIVKLRLVRHYGLKKYAPLVSFNAKLMVLSVTMDVLLIGLMSLPNQLVYTQFQPVVYTVKLNIELSMASLIARLAKGQANNDMSIGGCESAHARSGNHDRRGPTDTARQNSGVGLQYARSQDDKGEVELKTLEVAPPQCQNPVRSLVSRVSSMRVKRESRESKDIIRQTEVRVVVEDHDGKSLRSASASDDERPLHPVAIAK